MGNTRQRVVLCLALGPYLQKDWATSFALHEQALEGFRKFGDIYFQCVALRFIGDLLVKQGDLTQGMAALRESLVLARQLDSKYEIAAILWSLGVSTQRAGNFVRAVCLYWAAKIINLSIGAWWQEKDVEFRNNLVTCHAALEGSDFAAAEEQGRTMTMKQSIAFALEQWDN